MKTCYKCKLEKSLEEFSKSKQRKSGFLNSCKECDNKNKRAREAASKQADPEKYRERQRSYFKTYKDKYPDRVKQGDRRRALMDRYGITLEEYTTLLEGQGGKCATCPTVPQKRSLAVDHDHNCCPGKKTCGKCIRGLLCQNCNTALGLLKDDRNRLVEMINYLDGVR